MSSERKSITIDSASLIGGGGGSGSKRRTKRTSVSGERKIRPSSIVQPSTLKKTLLERIKQHQRTRERSRTNTDDTEVTNASETSTNDSHVPSHKGEDNFSQSMDFLRKLALKRREQQQRTQKKRTDFAIGLPEARTPEAKMMNQVSETLKNGEILTNTGLLGLPVVSMLPVTNTVSAPGPGVVNEPMIHLGAMPMQMPMQMQMPVMQSEQPTNWTQPDTPPKITELADMYNNTIAAVDATANTTTGTEEPPKESSDHPLHIPQNPEDYLPSIFIKEDPPHGCLKNGSKPTFREWATKILNKPVDTIKNMLGGGGSNDSSTSLAEGMNGDRGSTSNSNSNESTSTIDPEQIAGMRVKIRKTKKKRFRIGKHDDVVGVLLKNKQTQRHIQTQHHKLKQKTIGEIRKYLYDHHLLKIGSNAPPDVLRRMYEDAILTGEVKNTNNDVLLHNFMSGGGGSE